MFAYLSLFWFIRTTKFVLFYLYLWQLKGYHIGRFLDHFRTDKGRKTLINELMFFKVFLLISFLVLPYLSRPSLYLSDNFFLPFFDIYLLLPFVVIILYFIEVIKFFKNLFQLKLKFPVLTKKAVFLAFFLLLFEVLIISILFNAEKDLNFFTFWLLTVDIFIPILASVLILLFQPFVVLMRGRIISKAKEKRNNFYSLLVIGITGSYGKSSTKEFLHTILSEKHRVLKTKENQNSETGISRCILNDLQKDHEIFVVEMGAYSRGGIKLLCDIAKPKIGILTGINEQHLALFGSQENIIKAKYELIESLPRDGLAIFNGDDKHCLELYHKTKKPKKIFSTHPPSFNLRLDLWAENILVQKDFVFFKVCDQKGCANFKAYVPGAHFIPNLLAVILAAKEFGMSLQEISQACLKIKPLKRTMNIFEGKNRLTIIDDSYSANLRGVLSALEYLKVYHTKKIIILPCLIEMGKASKKAHKEIGEKIGRVCDAVVVTTKERFEDIKEGALGVGFKEENILFSDDPEEIIKIIKKFFDPGDVVLLEGRVPDQLVRLLAD